MAEMRDPGLKGKRLFDLCLALALAGPALLMIMLAGCVIRIDSPGPVLFRQQRVGRNGKAFTMYKLRTMLRDTGDMPSHFASASQLTRAGRWLRRTKLDELPQLINVIRGDMSFVGPRPCLFSQQELILARHDRGLDSLRPGITGPAQIAGIDMSDPSRLAEADAGYLTPWRLSRDLALIWATATGRGQGDAVTVARPGAS